MASYIAVEGVIGSGKSTLASALAKATSAMLFREPFVENPFLQRFYAHEPGTALPMQLQFLLARYAQQLEIGERRLRDQALVSDYAFEKEQVFAPLLLESPSDSEIHRLTYSTLSSRVRCPDVLVFLRVPVKECLAGIAERNRPMEQSISADYLSALAASYERWLSTYVGRVITLDGGRVRPNTDDAGRLVQEVLKALAIGASA